jgi:hypothetical protein
MRFAICTAAYPEAPSYIADYVAGVDAASREHPETELILAVEDGFDASVQVARHVAAHIAVRLEHAPGPTTPAGLRGLMLAAAAASDADVIVFADFDDRLLPGALRLHANALDEADISYGDMVLVDAAGRRLGRNYFDGAQVPDRVDHSAALLDRNFMGFTNTAVRRSVLCEDACAVPVAAAAADWWLFTVLLAGGRHARRAAAPVVEYRQHEGSTLGAAPAETLARLRARAALALEHHRLLADRLATADRQDALRRLIDAIDRGGTGAARLLSHARTGAGVWFDDVRRARDAIADRDILPTAGTA